MIIQRYSLLKCDPKPMSLSGLNCSYQGVTINVSNKQLEVFVPKFLIGGVELPINTANVDISSFILLEASTHIEGDLELTDDGMAIVPSIERNKCEEVLQYVVNVYAACNDARTKLYTPASRCISFKAETVDEERHLRLVKGIQPRNTPGSLGVGGPLPRNSETYLNRFGDRVEGLALMADAAGHSSYSGKLNDYIRLFESAFALPMASLDKKLVKLLNPNMGYTREEVKRWKNVRDSLSHADKKKSSEVLLNKDAAKYFKRVQQAALDVLFNKKIWHSASTLREEIWSPVTFLKDRDGGMNIVPGSTITLTSVDTYNVFEKAVFASIVFDD